MKQQDLIFKKRLMPGSSTWNFRTITFFSRNWATSLRIFRSLKNNRRVPWDDNFLLWRPGTTKFSVCGPFKRSHQFSQFRLAGGLLLAFGECFLHPVRDHFANGEREAEMVVLREFLGFDRGP